MSQFIAADKLTTIERRLWWWIYFWHI